MYIHQCNMVRSIPSLKMASMPRRRMTIMVHSANANAPKNGDSIGILPPFPIFLHHSNNFCICAILRIYLRFAVMYTLRTSFRSDSMSTTLHPQKHAIHAINPTSRIYYTLPKSHPHHARTEVRGIRGGRSCVGVSADRCGAGYKHVSHANTSHIAVRWYNYLNSLNIFFSSSFNSFGQFGLHIHVGTIFISPLFNSGPYKKTPWQ